jgi:hypothetical protein
VRKTRNTKTILLFLLTCILLTGTACAATIDVGSGYTYTTPGAGLAAASSGDRVHVHAGTYTISSALLVPSGVTFYGDGYANTILKMSSPTALSTDSNPAIVYINGKSNVEVYGFTFHGNGGSLAVMHDINNDYRNYCSGIKIKSSSGTTIHDCYFTLTYGDSIRSGSGNSDTYIYNCQMLTPGHDGVNMYYGSDWRMSNCIVNTFINAGMRMEGVNGAEVDHCTFYSDTDSGSGGVEMLREVGTGINIHHNVFRNMHNSNGVGIFTYSASSGNAVIANNIFYDCPGGYITCSGITYTDTGNQKGASSSTDWTAAGYGYNPAGVVSGGSSGDTDSGTSSDPVYNGSVLPTLTTPTAGLSLTSTNGNVTFGWSDVNSTSYRIWVSPNSGFSSFVHNTTSSTSGISLAIAPGTYYWKLSARNDSGGTWTSNTSSQSFTVTSNVESLTGIYGLIYETNTDNVIPGAVAKLTNESWSSTAVVGEDGYYRFQVPKNTGVYYLEVTATDYLSSGSLPINMSAEFYQEDVALVRSPTYFAPHYVRFVVTDYTLTERYEAHVGVYKGDLLLHNDTTGSDGAVTYKLDEEQSYTIVTTCVNGTTTDIITPTDSVYYIIVPSSTVNALPTSFYSCVDINVTKAEISSTQAYINITYNDTEVATTSLKFTVGKYSNNGTFVAVNESQVYNETWINAHNGVINESFIVSDFMGQDYAVRVDITHDTFGTVSKWHAVSFVGSHIPFTGKMLAYFGVFLLFIVALQFGPMEHATGAILLCGFFWLLYFVGMFTGFGENMTDLMRNGGILATVIAISAYLVSRKREEGI